MRNTKACKHASLLGLGLGLGLELGYYFGKDKSTTQIKKNIKFFNKEAKLDKEV